MSKIIFSEVRVKKCCKKFQDKFGKPQKEQIGYSKILNQVIYQEIQFYKESSQKNYTHNQKIYKNCNKQSRS